MLARHGRLSGRWLRKKSNDRCTCCALASSTDSSDEAASSNCHRREASPRSLQASYQGHRSSVPQINSRAGAHYVWRPTPFVCSPSSLIIWGMCMWSLLLTNPKQTIQFRTVTVSDLFSLGTVVQTSAQWVKDVGRVSGHVWFMFVHAQWWIHSTLIKC